ncbi:MAG TPA: hypothetical protein VNY52_01015 [Solirubrobacteraceae bacterium]|nr:hypothetical protein [Solirubrobacteraceae bacterium]
MPPEDDSQKEGEPERSPRRKPPRWLMGAVVAGLGGAITAAIISAGHTVKRIVLPTSPAAPLAVTAKLRSPGESCSGGAGWVFPRSAAQLPVPPHSDAGMQSWATQNGGVPASGNFVVVDLQGRPGPSVIVNDVRVEVTRRSGALTGTYAILSGGCGGVAPDYFGANLDREPVTIKSMAGVDELGHVVAAVPLPHQISASEPEVWYVRASTASCDCQWVAYLDWTANGESSSTRIGPFLTTATARAKKVILNGSGWSPF